MGSETMDGIITTAILRPQPTCRLSRRQQQQQQQQHDNDNDNGATYPYPPHLLAQPFERPRVLAQPVDLSVLGAIFFFEGGGCCDRSKGVVVAIQSNEWKGF